MRRNQKSMSEAVSDEAIPINMVLNNALEFLNAGLRLLFSEKTTSADAKVAIVSIQTAIELLLKYRLAKDLGLRIIATTQMLDKDLNELASSGELRTIDYNSCLRKVCEYEWISETEHELFLRTQSLRDSLVNFDSEIEVEEIRIELAWCLIGALAVFGAGQERDQGEMQTHRRFLAQDVFDRLISFEPYRSQAIDSAVDDVANEELYRCWECGVDALGARESDTYFCYCCGLTATLEMAKFVSCFMCEKPNSVCYDPLNEEDGIHHGRCLHCGKFVGVFVCQECGSASSQQRGARAPECSICTAPAR